MLNEIGTQVVAVSPAAAEAVNKIMAERNLEGYALRVYVAGGGCCGVNFGMALDNHIRDDDTTFESNGIKMVLDPVALDYLRGASIDFVSDPVQGSGFVIQQAHTPSGHGEGGCACGGSCAC